VIIKFKALEQLTLVAEGCVIKHSRATAKADFVALLVPVLGWSSALIN
jgi:hypothetical protein